jgi:hypothetical protein
MTFIGKKFAQVEFVACLVVLMQKWKIELPAEISKEDVLEATRMSFSVITLAPAKEIPLVFRRRSKK